MGEFNRERILKILKEHREELKKFGVKKIGLFGSYIRGEQKRESDIDILVEFEKGKKNFNNFIELAFFLEDLFGTKVDLLTEESMSPYLKPYIMREVVYESIP
jgi:hypothetical protein